MRPRFELQLPVTREVWLDALRSALQNDAESLRGQVFRKHAVVQMRYTERTFWSPYLSLEVEDGTSFHQTLMSAELSTLDQGIQPGWENEEMQTRPHSYHMLPSSANKRKLDRWDGSLLQVHRLPYLSSKKKEIIFEWDVKK